jgi:predicted PurR-regulated permease PerM
MEEAPRQTTHRFLLLLALVAVLLASWIILPFWKALLLAAILSSLLRQPMERLARLFRGRRSPAALVVTMGVLVALIIPLGGLGVIVVRQVVQGIQWVAEGLSSGGIHGLLERLPDPVAEAAREVAQALPEIRLRLEQLLTTGGRAAAVVGGAVAATSELLIRALLMLVALFFFLMDGQRLVAWVEANFPMRQGQLRGLLEEFRRTSRSVLVASFGTAIIQAVVAGVGYFVARAPVPVLLILLTLAAGLIPAVGGGVVVGLVGIVQIIAGHPISGVFLIGWGVAVVGLVDNFARPYLIKGGMELPGGVVFFALLGGIAAFGGIGLVVGPLIVTLIISVLKLLREDLQSSGPAAR